MIILNNKELDEIKRKERLLLLTEIQSDLQSRLIYPENNDFIISHNETINHLLNLIIHKIWKEKGII